MSRSVARWTILMVAFWAFGPASAYLMHARRAPDGGPDISTFVNDRPVLAAAAIGVALALALVTGIVSSRLFGTRTGLFAAGLVLVWPAWAAGAAIGMVRRAQSGSPLWTLAAEGLVLAVLAGASALLIARAYRPAPQPSGQAHPPAKARLMPALPIAAAVALVAAIAVARTDLPGQTIAAAFIAGLLGTMAASIIEPRLNPAPVMACLALLACVGPASAAMIEGANAVRHFYDGTINPLARITPLHWMAGLLLGVPVGASWASGFHKKPDRA